jgi:hypothetical protein
MTQRQIELLYGAARRAELRARADTVDDVNRAHAGGRAATRYRDSLRRAAAK